MPSTLEEKWANINNTAYQVSNLANIRNSKSNKILKSRKSGKYSIITIKEKIDGRIVNKKYYVHRLVADAFVPNPNNFSIVTHINPDKGDIFTNLRWTNQNEQVQNFVRRKKISKSLDKYKIKVYCEETDTVYDSIREASLILNLRSGNISNCCNGKAQSTGGYHFKKYTA